MRYLTVAVIKSRSPIVHCRRSGFIRHVTAFNTFFTSLLARTFAATSFLFVNVDLFRYTWLKLNKRLEENAMNARESLVAISELNFELCAKELDVPLMLVISCLEHLELN